MEGRIVFQGKSKNGKDMLIRYPKMDDLNPIWKYLNDLSKERTFVRFQGEEIKLEDEQKFLSSELKKINEGRSLLLLIFANDELIGISDIEMRDKTEKHIGALGISIAKSYRGEGIGTLFMEHVLDEARKNIKELKIVILQVYGNNSVAQGLYKKMGFKEFGKLPKGIFYKDEYIDDIFMYKEV